MTERAILKAAEVDERLHGDRTRVAGRWVAVRKAMQANKSTRELVGYLPQNIGRAVHRKRKERRLSPAN